MKILCLIYSLELGGGAQRVMSWLCEGLAQRGHTVSLYCLDAREETPEYSYPVGVEVMHLDLLKPSSHPLEALSSNLRRLQRLRQVFKSRRPEVILSFLDRTNVLALGAALGTGIPVLVSEHTDPARSSIGRLWALGRRWLYPQARQVVLLSEGMKSFFPVGMHSQIRALPNPVVIIPGDEVELPPQGRKRLLAVGRFHPVKGFDQLIEAFAALASRFPEWELLILGDGQERARLESLVQKLGLMGKVLLPGAFKNPFPFFRGADAYVLSSTREGFPLVIVEAMGCGLPVLATNCSPAVAEILEDGRLGLIVPSGDLQALKDGMARLLGDESLRESLREKAPEVARKYTPEIILDRWEALMLEVIS